MDMTHQRRDWERHIITLAATILLGLASWNVHKTSESAELIGTLVGTVEGMKGDIERLNRQVDSRYLATTAVQDYRRINGNLQSIEQRLLNIEGRVGVHRWWLESSDR